MHEDVYNSMSKSQKCVEQQVDTKEFIPYDSTYRKFKTNWGNRSQDASLLG